MRPSRRDPRASRSSLKSPRSETMTRAETPARSQRLTKRSAALSPSGSLSRAMMSRETPSGGTKAPRLPAESAAAAGTRGAALTSESTVSTPSPTRSVEPGTPKRTARPKTRPSALTSALGMSGDRSRCGVRREARRPGRSRRRPGRADAGRPPGGRAPVEAQGGEAAPRDPPGMEVGLGPPSIGHGNAARCAAPPLLRRMVGPSPGKIAEPAGRGRRAPRPWPRGAWVLRFGGGSSRAGRRALRWPHHTTCPAGPGLQADEERASGRAVEIARDPVAALLLALRQIAAADVLGARGERRGDFGAGEGVWGMADLLWIKSKKRPAPKRRPVLGSEWNVFPCYTCGRRHRRRLGVRAVAVAVPIRLVQELNAPARGE